MYEGWSYTKMVAELGEELADDLVARNKTRDPKRTGKFVRV